MRSLGARGHVRGIFGRSAELTRKGTAMGTAATTSEPERLGSTPPNSHRRGSSARRVAIGVALALIALLVADAIALTWRSDPHGAREFPTDNPWVTPLGQTQVSAHRSGGGIAPEESMAAFRNCIESPDFKADVFEFDLHITADDVLVLLHDDTLDRTTDAASVFGVADARPEDYTYEELRTLNIGANFQAEDGSFPYAGRTGDAVPDDVRMLRVEDVLDYLAAHGDFDFIIEIKNDGELGMRGVDLLYGILRERNLLDRVVFGTFNEEVSHYVDEKHPDLKRSATINEVVDFYVASLMGRSRLDASYVALQIPYRTDVYRFIANLGTVSVVNYAHEQGIAVQYWTINDVDDARYLSAIGADCIMTDYPDAVWRALSSPE